MAHQGKPFLAAVAADPSNSAIRLAMFPVLNSSYSKPYIVMLLLLVARSGANRIVAQGLQQSLSDDCA